MEASVVEVVLDTGAADPPGAAVHDDELPVVEVAEPAEVPGPPAARRRRLGPRPWPHGAHDADVHAAVKQPPVELAAGPVRARALPVHDEPDRHALRGLGQQRRGELLSDGARPEPELVDVDR